MGHRAEEPKSLDSVFIGEMTRKDGTVKYTRLYSTVGPAKAQLTRWRKTWHSYGVEDTRVLVASVWEEVK